MIRWIALAGLAIAAVVVAGCSLDGNGGDGGSGDGGGDGGAATSGDDELSVSTAQWETDFTKHSVPLSEFFGGGPPKDGIPSIDDPKFISQADADEYLEDGEPVAVLELDGVARAYPIQVLTWHEIVNDEIEGQAVAVTFCPLCNSTVAFSREFDGEAVEFGTTGNLRRSDLVMYDRRTESWWQQLTAEAIVGELTGTELEVLPTQILSWEEFRKQHPDSQVLSRDTGFDRPYGQNPYTGYDSAEGALIGIDEPPDDALPAKERVTAVQTGQGAVVYPFSRLEKDAPINDEIDGKPIVVLFDPDVRSALDSANIAEGRNTGGGGVFERALDGRALTFEAGDEAGSFRDAETGSTWNVSGLATAGELEGTQLAQIASDDQFWFALAAFFENPDIRS